MRNIASALLASFILCLLLAANLKAGEAKYIYDDLGRLHQVIDEQGNVATYNYDAVGNLLSITRSDGGLTGPSLSAVTPDSANAGQTVTVTLSGTKLSGGVLRTDNPGISISGVQTTATSLKATLAIAYTARTGGTALTVNTPIGSATIPFTVQPTAPAISELHPDNGPVSRLVRINGVGFSNDRTQVSVTFGGIPATVINTTPTAIDTQVPPGVSGTDVPVVVTVNGLTSAAKTFFPQAASGPPPVITSVTPIQGSEQGGQTVRIRGSGFSANPEVSIGDYHVVKSTFYFICIFKGSFESGGMLTAGSGGGVVHVPCTIGPRNFYKFLGIPVARMTVIDDTTMDVVTPPGPIGPAHVLVSNSNGDALLTNGFTYLVGPPQQIVGVTPNMGRIDIPTNAPMKVLFTRPVDRSSVTPSSFSLIRSSDSSPVPGSFSFEANDTTVGFTPTGGLAPDTAYQLTVTQDLKSVDGIPLDGLFTGFFTTAAGADTLSPTLTVTPANGAANVPYNSSITVVFSEPINPLTFNKTTVIVSNNGAEKAGFIFVGEQNSVATFVPASPFFPGTPVSVTLKGTISDFAGNPIVGNNGAGSDYQFSFTTALTQDLFPPQVLQINPVSGSTGISATASISVTFNESLDPASVNNSTFIVSSGGVATPGTIVFSNFNTVATYLPSQPLPGLSQITVTLTTGVTDVAGNATAAPFNASFTTASSVDNFQPSVLSTSPFNGQTGVPQNGKITLVFSERINPATITSSSFFVNGPAGQVSGQIAVSADQTSATFTPSVALLPNAGHTIHFGNQIKDIAGNALFNPGSRTFTTRSGPDDTTGPSVVEIGPANGAVNFPLNGHLLIRFNEAIAGTSLNAQTVILSKGGQPVDADLTLERNGTVVRVKSANLVNLASNAFYELTVTTGVKDVAGNPLTASFTSAFTTGAGADTTPPAQLSSNPSQGSSGVPTRAGISATFSEPINPLTASFIVIGGGINGAIPGSYTLSPDLKTVTFTPDHPLPANQTYFVSRGPMEDFAGNLATGPTWLTIFTTDYAAGTDLSSLPTSATVVVNPSSLYADGETTTTVIISNISRGGVLVPNGTKVAVTVDPAYRLDSAGGSILGGTPSVSDPRFKIFTTLGGSISFTYRSPNLPNLLPGQASPAFIQVAQIDAGEGTMGVIGVGGITLFRGSHVTVSPNPVNLLAAPGSRSQVSITVFDPFGKPVPAGMRVGITTEPVYYLHSLAGDFVGGTPAADPRFTIYTTITGGIVEADYIPPVLAANQTGFGIVQVVEVDDAGHVLALMGTIGVINLSGSSGQTAPQPVVLAASPVQGQSGVGLNAPVVVAFSQSLDPASVTTTTFSIASGGVAIPGSRALSSGVGGPDSVVTFTPAAPFSPNAVISVLVGSSIKSASGSPLLSGQSFTFSTGTSADTIAPSVSLINPANGTTGVGTNNVVTVQFSESMNAVSITPQSFILSVGGVSIPGRVSVTNRPGDAATPSLLAIFTPDQLLSPDTTYTVSLSAAITDTAGNLLAPFTSTFTTGSGIDNFQPSVIAISPYHGQTGVPQNAKVILAFSEPMNPATIGPSTFFVSGPAGGVAGEITVSADRRSVSFTPSVPLLPNAGHSIIFTGQITDVAGNSLSNPTGCCAKGFTTRSGPADTSGPSVLEMSPADGATAVPLNAHLLIRFDEPITQTSANDQSIVVSSNGVAVPGVISLTQNNTLLRWTPADLALLSANATYQVNITTSVTDLSGNPLAASFVSAFTTGTAADTTPPVQISATVGEAASNRTTISATFGEPINPLTVIPGGFILTGGGVNGAIPGSYTLSSDLKTVTFTSDNPLPRNQTYFVSRGPMEDFAGNQATGPTWLAIFTTDYAAGTDLNTLPTSATVVANTDRLYADGETTTTVIISNINRGGILAPNGTKVAVTADPAYRLDSAGGAIIGGTPSVSDPRFRIFTTLGGSITFTYRSANLPNLLPGQASPAFIQVAQIDAGEGTMGVIGVGGITLFRGSHVTVSPNPVNLLAVAGSRSQVSITVFDPFGKPVPAGMRVGITAEPVYYLHSRGGSFTGGTPAADSRFKIYSTIIGGIVETEYIPPVLPSSQSGSAILQVVEIDDTGHVLGPAPMGIGVINLSGSSGQTAPQPVVLAASPVQGQSGVGLNAPIVVAFSQSLDPASVTATTFSVSSGAPVLGTRTLSAGVGGPNSVVTFVPNGALAPNSVINVLVGSGIKSASGSPLLSGQSFAFSTGLEADTTAPSVDLVNPANGATGVGTNAVVMVQFSENVNAANVTTETLTLSAGGVLVPGRVSVGSRVGDAATPSLIATFTPDQLLSANTTYTVQLNSAITDTAGNALVPFTAGFTTASGIDNFQPSVSTINPANSSVDVPSDIAISVTFSEPMNPETINEMTFSLSGPSVVKAAYSFSNGNTVATLTPLQPLLAGGQYTITLTTLIRDVAGNPLPGSLTSRFTTALAPGTANLPTSATVTVNPGSLFANGQIATTVTISNISRNGVLVPNGTLIAVTAEPAFSQNSVGGVISGGSVGNSADPRFLLFSSFGAEVTVSYTPPDLTGKGVGNVGIGSIQVASVDLDHRPVSLIGSGAASFFGIGSAAVVASLTSIVADGVGTSTLTVTVKNPQGGLVPDGTRVALTAATIFSQASAGGTILEGTASASDSRVKIFTTAGGQFTATYQGLENTGTVVIQVMTINAAGLPTALLATTSITLTAPPTVPPLMANSCRGPSSGMVSCWQGEGNADDSVGANHGTLQNGAAFAAGKIGQGFGLDGINDLVLVPDTAGLDITGPLTVEAWVKVNALHSLNMPIVWKGNSSGQDASSAYSFLVQNDGTLLGMIGNGSAANYVFGTATVPIGTLFHVAFVITGSKLQLYLNGQLHAEAPQTISPYNSTFNLQIGSIAGNAPFSLNGLVDELKIYNRALSAEEIEEIAICRGGSALVSCWQGDGNADDAIGVNHGTLQGGASFASGQVGPAFSFDGIDDYVSVPNSPNLNISSALSVEAWINMTDLPINFPVIVTKGPTNAQYLIFINATAGAASGTAPVCFRINIGPSNPTSSSQLNLQTVCSTSKVTFGQFIHVAGVFDGSSIKIYVNKALEGSTAVLGSVASDTRPLTIGAGDGVLFGSGLGNQFHGKVDEVKIFNSALSCP